MHLLMHSDSHDLLELQPTIVWADDYSIVVIYRRETIRTNLPSRSESVNVGFMDNSGSSNSSKYN